eukprot:365709-Chlamydomonas_euryale.AAC.1
MMSVPPARCASGAGHGGSAWRLGMRCNDRSRWMSIPQARCAEDRLPRSRACSRKSGDTGWAGGALTGACRPLYQANYTGAGEGAGAGVGFLRATP